jgi:hypothetical protein
MRFTLGREDVKDQVYLKEWYSKILLKKKTPASNFDSKSLESNAEENADATLPNQKTYDQSIVKSYFEFKLIEITSEFEIKEHMSFIHPI